MPHTQDVPPDLMALPDWAVLTDKQTTELLGVSLDTLGRLDRAGEGPPRVRLSTRRHGRPVGELRKWLQRRLNKANLEDRPMRATKSPGAVAAPGASKSDPLGGKVFSENKRQKRFAQPPIRAELIGSDRCEADGITACGYAPVFDLCRKLVAAGFNPASPLEAWRGETLCLRVPSIGEGARLTVADDRHGTPRLRRRQERPQGCVAGSPVAQINNGRGVPTPRQSATSEAAP